MKKHLIVVMNIILILAVIGAIIFTVLSAMKNQREEDAIDTSDIVAATAAPAETRAKPEAKVGIIQHGLGNASKDCYEGFITELNERGLLEKLEIVYIVEDNEQLCRDKIQQLVEDGCDLLYTIGRFATEAAAEITKEIPIVFGAVNSPDEVGLVESNEVPGGNVTGVSSFTPCFEQIDLIPLVLPKAKTVAAIYSATDADSVLQGIIASKESDKIGIKCSQYPVDDKDSLADALDKIKEADTHVIYIPVDKFLSAQIETLKTFSYDNKIPIICGDEATLELGAFATSEVNYSSIGSRAAGMANDILFGGKSPATLSVMYKHDCNNIVNKEVMDKLGITVPAKSLETVEIRRFQKEEAVETEETAPAAE